MSFVIGTISGALAAGGVREQVSMGLLLAYSVCIGVLWVFEPDADSVNRHWHNFTGGTLIHCSCRTNTHRAEYVRNAVKRFNWV